MTVKAKMLLRLFKARMLLRLFKAKMMLRLFKKNPLRLLNKSVKTFKTFHLKKQYVYKEGVKTFKEIIKAF